MADPTPQELLEQLYPPVQIPVNGQIFVETGEQDTTIERDVWVMAKARAANLDGLSAVVDFEDSQAVEAILREILGRILESGVLFDMLAGLLVPEGERWSRAKAIEYAEQFKLVTEPKAKEAMMNACGKLVLGFFTGAASVSTPSPKSSGRSKARVAKVKAPIELPQEEVPSDPVVVP